MKFWGHVLWGLVSLVAAFCLAGIAIYRGEPINSIWIVIAAVCTYAVGFRFYAKFIAATGHGAGRSARDSSRTSARRPRLRAHQ